jgi:DNA polymerase-3 subunit alpha
MIDSIKEITTKNNEEMAFINASDETGSMEYVLFPKIWDRYRNIKAKDILLVQGNVERRLDKYQIVINRLEKLNK